MSHGVGDFVRALGADTDLTKTLGQLSEEYGESVDRIVDALDTLKMLHFGIAGRPVTYIEVKEKGAPP